MNSFEQAYRRVVHENLRAVLTMEVIEVSEIRSILKEASYLCHTEDDAMKLGLISGTSIHVTRFDCPFDDRQFERAWLKGFFNAEISELSMEECGA